MRIVEREFELWLTTTQVVTCGLLTAGGLIGFGVLIGRWIWGG